MRCRALKQDDHKLLPFILRAYFGGLPRAYLLTWLYESLRVDRLVTILILNANFFKKNWKVSLKYEGCLAGKRWIAFRQSGWLPAICFPAFFLPLFIVSPGSVLVGNPAWKTTPCLFMKKCFKDINEKQLHDFGRSCYFLKSSLIITLIGFVLRFYVFCTFFLRWRTLEKYCQDHLVEYK